MEFTQIAFWSDVGLVGSLVRYDPEPIFHIISSEGDVHIISTDSRPEFPDATGKAAAVLGYHR